MWKDFFYFSKRDRQGILVLVVLIAGIFAGKYLFTTAPQAIPEEQELRKEPEKTLPEVNEPIPVVIPKSPVSNSKPDKPVEKRRYYQQAEKTPEPPPPNHFRKAEKFPEGTVIELNACDTSQLVKIPGIGPSFAKRISGYRNKLGGYYRKEQLQEVYEMYEELYVKIIPYFRIDTNLIVKIPVNTASLDKMKSHPYLNFYQAKVIIEIRKKKGKVESLTELSLLEEFSEEDLERIEPYLEF
jgi:DNA uptake protein ComE-like DNA-binding protein